MCSCALVNRHDKEIGINLPDSLGLDFQYDSIPKPGAQKGVHAKVKLLKSSCVLLLSLQNVYFDPV